MKHLLSIIFILIFSLASGQSTPAIKIYLEDAETGKNICDAKVTLEGFEIPPITGKYDKKEKYYYFTEIPKGYNTIMSYHKKYNEKGYQNIEGLPKELKLKLCDPLNVSYDFEKYSSNKIIFDPGKGKYITLKNYKKIYIEDPYKICLLSFWNNHKKILKKIDSLNLKIEPINPYYSNKLPKDYVYPKLDLNKTDGWPMIDGYFYGKNRNEMSVPVIFFRKIDGSKFKRFNDPILFELRKITGDLKIIKYLKLEYSGNNKYKKSFSKELDKQFVTPDSLKSQKILYECWYNSGPKFIIYSFDKLSELSNRLPDLFDDDKNVKEKYKFLFSNKGLGLGLFDQMEYFSNN